MMDPKWRENYKLEGKISTWREKFSSWREKFLNWREKIWTHVGTRKQANSFPDACENGHFQVDENWGHETVSDAKMASDLPWVLK